MNFELSSASQELASVTSTEKRLFFCPACGGVWWAVYAPMCSGSPSQGTGHSLARMQRADTVACGNTPGLEVEP